MKGQTDIFDALEVPRPLPVFTVYLSSVFPAHPCGYCGNEITTNTGNGGGAEGLPDGRNVRWFICDRCGTGHGWPDIQTHPNLKVVP